VHLGLKNQGKQVLGEGNKCSNVGSVSSSMLCAGPGKIHCWLERIWFLALLKCLENYEKLTLASS